MPSITTLSIVPEILFEILKHLENLDVYSLLQTCKSLYQACYASLWHTISFRFPPSYINSSYRQPLQMLIGAIRENPRGAEGLGFEHTRVLELGLQVFGVVWEDEQGSGIEPVEIGAELIVALRSLVDSGKLNLRRLTLRLDRIEENFSLLANGRQLLQSIRRYSQSQSGRDLSISLETDTVQDIKLLFDTTLITDLSLYIQKHDKLLAPLALPCWAGESPGSHITELTDLLASLSNLRVFHWMGEFDYETEYHAYPRYLDFLSEAGDQLSKLQNVFSQIKTLRQLKIGIPFFHQSFFLVPPYGVRILHITSSPNREWWAEFARHPMSSVEELEIDTKGWAPETEDSFAPIGEVAINGLKRLYVTDDYDGPLDLEECIYRNNKRLSKYSLDRIVKKRVDAVMWDYVEILEDAVECATNFLRNRYVHRLIDDPDGDHRKDYAKDFAQTMLGNVADYEVNAPVDLMSSQWRSAQGKARRLGFQIRDELTSLTPDQSPKALADCISHVEDLSTPTLVKDYGSITAENFLAECLKLLTQSPEFYEIESWQRGRSLERTLEQLFTHEIQQRLKKGSIRVRAMTRKNIFDKEQEQPTILFEAQVQPDIMAQWARDALDGLDLESAPNKNLI